MRFKKGSKVEVLSRKEVVTGAWLCAEIVSGNGHTYSVKYGWFPMTNDAVVERVLRKAIRPCPPPVEGAGNWVHGDLVEVFHNLSWKTATIMKVIDGHNFLVRILGMFQEVRVHRSHLRVRQSWQDGKWFVVGKGSENCKMSTSKKNTDTRIKLCVGDDCFSVKKNIESLEPQMVCAGTLKRRSPLGSSLVDAYSVAVQKMRAVEKNSSGHRIFQGELSPFSEKVDAFVSPQKVLGEKYMHASFGTGANRFSKKDGGRGEPNGYNDSFVSGSLTPTDIDSSLSSVASCSVTDNGLHCITNHSKDTESHCSDAESFCGWGYEDEGCSHSTKGDLVPKIHGSELHAYRCAIGALYVSGPLSWEEEEKHVEFHYEESIPASPALLMAKFKLCVVSDGSNAVKAACRWSVYFCIERQL